MNKTYAIIIALLTLTFLSACNPAGATVTIPATDTPTPTGVLTAALPTGVPTAAIPTSTPTVVLWEDGSMPITPENARKVKRLQKIDGGNGRMWTLVYSDDGKYFASTDQNGINLRDAANGKPAFTLFSPGLDFNSIVFSPDSRLLASARTIWDVETRQVLHGLDSRGFRPAFSPDGAWLAVGGEQPIKIWDVDSGQLMRTFATQAGDTSFSLVFSPDGTLLAESGNDRKVTIWDVASGRVAHNLTHGTQGDVHDLAFSPDGQWLVTAGTDNTVRLWDVVSGQELQIMSHNSGLYGVTFSPDGKIIASASCDRKVRLWEAASGKLLTNLSHGDEVTAVAFSPDGTQLASAAYDQYLYLWGIPR
jgi:WD40 repeat protein